MIHCCILRAEAGSKMDSWAYQPTSVLFIFVVNNTFKKRKKKRKSIFCSNSGEKKNTLNGSICATHSGWKKLWRFILSLRVLKINMSSFIFRILKLNGHKKRKKLHASSGIGTHPPHEFVFYLYYYCTTTAPGSQAGVFVEHWSELKNVLKWTNRRQKKCQILKIYNNWKMAAGKTRNPSKGPAWPEEPSEIQFNSTQFGLFI